MGKSFVSISDRANKMVGYGDSLMKINDSLDALRNEPDSTNDKYDDLITKTSLVVSHAELLSGVNKTTFDNPNISNAKSFSKSTLTQAHVLLVATSTVNAIKHYEKGNYHKTISNGFVALSSSAALLGHALPEKLNDFKKSIDAIVFFSSWAGFASGKGQDIADFGYEMVDKSREFFGQDFSQKFADTLNEKFPNYADKFAEHSQKFGDFFGNLVDKFRDSKTWDFQDTLAEILDPVREFAMELGGFGDEFSKWFDETKKQLIDLWGDIIELTRDFGNDAWNWLQDNFDRWKNTDRSGNYYIYDPLILDLDGDGIETVGIDFKTASNNAYFDFDNDGRLNATGWVKSDDGLLVRDLNNDGLINNGSEIFGDRTLKQNGELAKTGTWANNGEIYCLAG